MLAAPERELRVMYRKLSSDKHNVLVVAKLQRLSCIVAAPELHVPLIVRSTIATDNMRNANSLSGSILHQG